jgi:hypothetical protein
MGRALTVDDDPDFGPRVRVALTGSAPIVSRQPVFGLAAKQPAPRIWAVGVIT